MVCTKTLYNYVNLGLLPIKNIDLPEKLKRNTKSSNARKNRRILGKSIEERPETVNSREEFGHWEIGSVLGKKERYRTSYNDNSRKTNTNVIVDKGEGSLFVDY